MLSAILSRLKIWGEVLRLHQWLKNVLLLIPMFAAHSLTDLHQWFLILMAFFSFSLMASGGYVLNDLCDLKHDKKHLRKRHRPIASGLISLKAGWFMVFFLIILSNLLAIQYVGINFTICMAFYFLFTASYSYQLKRFVLIDCLILGLLYTMRIIAGAIAVHLNYSFWLLAFSVFLFLSLAFLKRFIELQYHFFKDKTDHEPLSGRGYIQEDITLLQNLGVSSGYAAVLVLALYLNSATLLGLYLSPEWLWGAVLVMLFWISWMWMQACRQNMPDDPFIFAVSDKVSLIAGLLFLLLMFLGAMG